MAGRVIQEYFIGGAMRPQPAPRAAAAGARPSHSAGAPPPAFAGRAPTLQARMAPGRPPPAHQGAGHVAQPHGGNGSFEIDPVQLGLARGGGKPLPQALLAKMEAAFGADFSAVRVHVGAQASRIGAMAFTTGNDIYFAPGRFQPESAQGRQLIGHELAHVVQQRQGRVRAPLSGVAVVQDQALEAEADRLGMRAAMHRPHLAANAGRPAQAWSRDSRMVQRAEAKTSYVYEKYGGGQSELIMIVPSGKQKSRYDKKMEELVAGTDLERGKRSFDKERKVQILRWISTVIFEYLEHKKETPVEIQAYWTGSKIIISSNKKSVNDKLLEYIKDVVKLEASHKYTEGRPSRHARKLFIRDNKEGQSEIYNAFVRLAVEIPTEDIIDKETGKDVDLHAERRIASYLKTNGVLNAQHLGGVKRPCLVCARALNLKNQGPGWNSAAALSGYDLEDVKAHAIKNGLKSHVTRSRTKGNLETGHGSDSESDEDS